jgi:hypothetical protein
VIFGKGISYIGERTCADFRFLSKVVMPKGVTEMRGLGRLEVLFSCYIIFQDNRLKGSHTGHMLFSKISHVGFRCAFADSYV